MSHLLQAAIARDLNELRPTSTLTYFNTPSSALRPQPVDLTHTSDFRDDVHELIRLVSNFDHPRHVRKVLTDHCLDGYFRTVVISGDVGVTKPDPRIFEPALKEAGMQACEVVYVGDTAEDVIGARGAGLISILIRRQIGGTDPRTLDFSESSDPESPGYVDGVDANVKRVSSLGELLELLT